MKIKNTKFLYIFFCLMLASFSFAESKKRVLENSSCVNVQTVVYQEEKFYIFNFENGDIFYFAQKPNTIQPPYFSEVMGYLKAELSIPQYDGEIKVYFVEGIDERMYKYIECGFRNEYIPLDVPNVIGTST